MKCAIQRSFLVSALRFFSVLAGGFSGLATWGQALLEWGWEAELGRVEAWQAQPSWQSNPAPGAACRRDGEALEFSVPDSGCGMKWSHSFQPATFDSSPYLVLRYRAEGLLTASDNYLVFINDGSNRETAPFKLSDAVADGQWHLLAVDLRGVAQAGRFAAVAVQVRATQGPARLWISTLRLAEHPPAEAVRLGEKPGADTAATPAAWWADLTGSQWEPRRDWLANPAVDSAFEKTDAAVLLRVPGPGRGMKWSWFFRPGFPLSGYSGITLRYRATGTAPEGDYAISIMGTAAAAGSDYAPVIMPSQLRHDGLWHTLTVPLSERARQLPGVAGFAAQIQAAQQDARIEISRLGLTTQAEAVPALEYLLAEPGAFAPPLTPLPLTASARLPLAEVIQAEGLSGWPEGATVQVGGVPFTLPAATDVVPASGLRECSTVRLPVSQNVSEVYLLLLGVFRGAEEEVYSTEGQLVSITEIDRFSVALRYADGSSERCFPCNLSAGRAFRVDKGAQALCVFADAQRTLAELVLTDNSPGAAFVVLAATANPGPTRCPDPDLTLPDLALTTDRRVPATEAAVRALLALAEADGWLGLWTVSVGGKDLPPERFQRTSATADASVYRCADPALELRLTHRQSGAEFALEAVVTNGGAAPLQIGLSGPRLGPLLLGDRVPEHQWYWFPGAGNRLGNEPFWQQARYGGGFPLQIMSAFNPITDDGVYLRTLDLAGIPRDYGMQKAPAGVALWVDTAASAVPPQGALAAPPTRLGITGGDWRTAFAVYRDWVREWYRPVTPRQAWFRDVYNFRQRFLHGHDPLYDARTGTYSLQTAIAEGVEQFGGIEYIHLFDWGSLPGVGRVYGRTGDVSPLDSYLKGGADAFRRAIADVQRQGIQVGLYIEGYLLEEKGRLGQAHGKEWQIRLRDGQPLYWPQSSEMMICSAVPAWREVQADTYASRVRELDVDGMYLDQFGFANPGKDCWSPDHGHPVPSSTMLGERGLSRQVRERLAATKPGVVLYDEEVPCDVNSQNMDGSFTYHMNHSRWSRPLAPLQPLRFAIPSFKTFEILVCDHPMGSWAEGVKWTFFNGEGIWLEGTARDWFAPRTLETIRAAHAILREHRDAFATDAPVPLQPTFTPGVLANLFPTSEKVVMTLYNARHRSTTAVVPVPPTLPAAAQVLDAWNRRTLKPRDRAGQRVVLVDLEPRDVGCLVFRLTAP
jgi:hypothetical protein